MAKKEILLKLACGNKKDNFIDDIKECCGNIKDCVEFVNNEFSKRFLKSQRKEIVVFNVSYSNKDELLDFNNWLTLEELIEGEIFVEEEK